jgi:UrcA family protein
MDQSRCAARAASMLLACVFFASGAIAAETDRRVPTETVEFGDLNLAKTEGVAALFTRIQSAARHVCSVSGVSGVRAAQNSRKCVRQSVGRAIEELNLPALTAIAAIR